MSPPFSAWWLLLAGTTLWAQETPGFRSDTALALVNFHVVRQQRLVADLKREDLVLLEDGVERPITLFEGGDSVKRTTPVNVGLVFDTSSRLTDTALLNPQVFKSSLLDALPAVRLVVYGFSDKMYRYCEPTRDIEVLRTAMAALATQKRGPAAKMRLTLPSKREAYSGGATWLYESIIAAATDSGAPAPDTTRMLLVFSDGLGSTSTVPEDAASVCREVGVPVYPILLGHWDLAERVKEKSSAKSLESFDLEAKERDVSNFAKLGEMTGGRSFDPRTISQDGLTRLLDNVAAEVRTEYVAGFPVPSGGSSSRRHKLEIRLRDNNAGMVAGGTRTIVH